MGDEKPTAGLMPVSPVAVGHAVFGAVTSGPTHLGNFNVMGKTQLPGEFQIAGDRYSVINKMMQPGERYQGEPGVMMYMSSDVKMEARFAGWRAFSGEGFAKLKHAPDLLIEILDAIAVDS